MKAKVPIQVVKKNRLDILSVAGSSLLTYSLDRARMQRIRQGARPGAGLFIDEQYFICLVFFSFFYVVADHPGICELKVLCIVSRRLGTVFCYRQDRCRVSVYFYIP